MTAASIISTFQKKEPDDPVARSILKCICGSCFEMEDFRRFPERGTIEVVCHSCGTMYGLPIDHPFFAGYFEGKDKEKEAILYPGFQPATEQIQAPPKSYNCKRCGEPISKEQALRTFNGAHEKALCQDCEEAV